MKMNLLLSIIPYCTYSAREGIAEQPDLENHEVQELYEKYYTESKRADKSGHDYGRTWRDMRVGSLTDLILQNF